MQGKERNNREIDDEFVSQAWDSMKHMLDQEMPVNPNPVVQKEHPNRRIPLMLLLLLISFGAGAAWMYWYYQGPEPQPPKEEAPRAMLFESATTDPSTIAEIKTSEFENKSTLNTSTPTNKDKPAPNPTAEELEANSPVARNQQASDINASATQKSNIQFGWVDHSGTSLQIQKTVVPRLQQNLVPILSVQEKAKGGDQLAPTEAFLPEQNLSSFPLVSDRTSIEPLELLASLNPIESFKETDAEISPSFFKPVNKKWRLAVEASFIRDNGTKEFSNSYSIGALIERQLDNRFAIQSGVAWHHLNKRSKASKNNQNVVNSFDLDSTENFVLEDYYENAVETGVLEILDYIKVPLQLTYKVNEKIRIHTGVHAAYLLSPIRLGAKDEVPTLVDGEKPSKEVLDETRRTFVREGLKKMDFGVQVGMGIYPTKRLGLFVNYNSGLLDFSDNEHFQFREVHSNQYVQLGLVYYPFKR